jgi:membrane dipeptidase
LKNLCLTVLCLGFLWNIVNAQTDYKALHQQALVVDMHTDVLLQVLRGVDISKRLDHGHVDLVRLREGGVDVQFFAVWPNSKSYHIKSMFEQSMHLIDLLEKVVAKNQDKIVITRSPEEIIKAESMDKIAACIGVEGGTAIESDLDKLNILYNRGVRYLGLTWNESPDWASCAKDEISEEFEGDHGLSPFGKEVILEMNRLGMIIDISHSGDKTFWDVIQTTHKPIIASHSGVFNLCYHYRNLKDEQIKAIGRNGGVIFINFYPGYLQSGFGGKYQALIDTSAAFLDSVKQNFGNDFLGFRKFKSAFYSDSTEAFRPGVERIVDHMDYIISLIGDDHVGLGSDFDGISLVPKGIEDASRMPEITRVMMERGYRPQRIRKILGGNFMRVFRAVSGLKK